MDRSAYDRFQAPDEPQDDRSAFEVWWRSTPGGKEFDPEGLGSCAEAGWNEAVETCAKRLEAVGCTCYSWVGRDGGPTRDAVDAYMVKTGKHYNADCPTGLAAALREELA